jgi:hypothetical protein
MAFVETLKNLHPQRSPTTLVAMLPPLIGVCVVFNHRIAFIFVIIMANIEVVFQEGDKSSASEGGMRGGGPHHCTHSSGSDPKWGGRWREEEWREVGGIRGRQCQAREGGGRGTTMMEATGEGGGGDGGGGGHGGGRGGRRGRG